MKMEPKRDTLLEHNANADTSSMAAKNPSHPSTDFPTNEVCHPAPCSQLPDSVIRALRHARLFIGERRGYRSNEEAERDDICRQIDTILLPNTTVEPCGQEPRFDNCQPTESL